MLAADKMMKDGVQVSHVDAEFVELLAKWNRQQFLICAGTSGTDEGESTATQGLVQGHAYTIQSVVKVDGFKMLRWGLTRWLLMPYVSISLLIMITTFHGR